MGSRTNTQSELDAKCKHQAGPYQVSARKPVSSLSTTLSHNLSHKPGNNDKHVKYASYPKHTYPGCFNATKS